MTFLSSIVKTILLGIIQGITEWLPISSTGHLILFASIWQVLPESMAKMSIMTQAPGAFFCYGVLMAGCVWLEGKLDARIERKSCCDLDNLKKEAE